MNIHKQSLSLSVDLSDAEEGDSWELIGDIRDREGRGGELDNGDQLIGPYDKASRGEE